MSDEILKDICKKIDCLILLSAKNTVKGLNTNEAILLLGDIGLDRNLIARVAGTTPGTVSVRLSEAKARRGASARKADRRER